MVEIHGLAYARLRTNFIRAGPSTSLRSLRMTLWWRDVGARRVDHDRLFDFAPLRMTFVGGEGVGIKPG